MATVANVAITDTFDQWRIKTNQTIKIVNDVESMTHPLANLAGYASNTANAVANSAGELAYQLVTSDSIFMSQVFNYANANVRTVINTVYTDIYDDSNASFIRSNTALAQSNIARNQANSAVLISSLAYDTANNFLSNATSIASDLYVDVYNIANASYNTANNFVLNTANIVANVILSNTITQNTLNIVASHYIENFLANVSFIEMYDTANVAYLQANTARSQANTARNSSNSAIDIASAAFDKANTGVSTLAVTIFEATNTAFTAANNAYNQANSGVSLASDAYSSANGAYDRGTAAYNQANTVFGFTASAFSQANTARNTANTATTIATAAFAQANSSGGGANVAIINNTSTNNDNFYLTMARQVSGNATNLTVSSTKAYFNPSSGTLSATVFNSLSDENMKDDVHKIENALDIIEKIVGVEFVWKESGNKSSGVIAQNLINVVPYLVKSHEKENNERELTVNYNGLTALFIESIKELNREVKAIKSKLGM